MPFTLSHPALVIPLSSLRSRWFSDTALIIGSIVPDFEYFLRMAPFSRYSHTWKGLYWFDVPLGLILCFVFHNIVRNPLIQNAPFNLNIKLLRYQRFNWNAYYSKKWLIILVSLFIGSLSHIVWDRLAHKSYYFLSVIPGLKDSSYIVGHPLRVYRIFQTFYSTIGLAVVLRALWKVRVDNGLTPIHKIKSYWIAVGVAAAAIFTFNMGRKDGIHLDDFLGSMIGAFLFALIIISFFTSLFAHRRMKEQ